MVSKLASSAVDHGFEPRSGQALSLNVSLEQIKVYHLYNNRIPNIKKTLLVLMDFCVRHLFSIFGMQK
jgi:hypothetical protein